MAVPYEIMLLGKVLKIDIVPLENTQYNVHVYERRSDKRVLRAFEQFLCNQHFKNV